MSSGLEPFCFENFVPASSPAFSRARGTWYKIILVLLNYLNNNGTIFLRKYGTLISVILFVCVCNAQGSKLGVVSPKDLITILASNPRMKALLCETANAFVQRETGCVTGIERAVQAATAPTLGQQMLQRGSRCAIANGISHEQSSVSVNAEGEQVAERLVERGVLLPNGQGVHIQQSAQQVVLSDSELGKRKISDDLERVEIRLRNLQCDKMEIEQEQLKK